MRNFTNNAIKTAQADAQKMYAKLASITPNETLSRDDIRTLMFIVEHYQNELKSIERERERKKHR